MYKSKLKSEICVRCDIMLATKKKYYLCMK